MNVYKNSTQMNADRQYFLLCAYENITQIYMVFNGI